MTRILSVVLLCFVVLASLTNVTAFPEGAPWGAADPTVRDHCASCHWERPERMQSSQLQLSGLPKRLQAGETYALSVTLSDKKMRISGFQLLADANGQTAGEFISRDANVETALVGTAIRSVQPVNALAGRVRWKLQWRAPSTLNSPVTFTLAAAAANDDGSPFGDVIHYKTIEAQ